LVRGFASARPSFFPRRQSMTKDMPSTEADGIVPLRFPNLGKLPFLVHAVTTRFDSRGREFNLALHVGHHHDDALKNRAALCGALGFQSDSLTCCEQVHGSQVAFVEKSSVGRGAFSRSDALQGFDAMVTNVPGALLAMFAADCPLTVLADPKRRAIGICHSGWRGLAAGVVFNTVAAMYAHFGTVPHDLRAGIAPSIEKSCYEVGEEVAEQFAATYGECVTSIEGGKFTLDLRGIVLAQLLAAGLKRRNIEQSGLCTRCQSHLLFSYRRDGEKAGRFALAAGIKVRQV